MQEEDTSMGSFVCKFQVYCETRFGQSVVLIGRSEELGYWDPFRGVKLNYVSDYVWESEEIMIKDMNLEYKYCIAFGNELIWEDGENRRINLFKANVLYLNDTFGDKFQSRILSKSEPLNIMTFNIRFANNKDKFQWSSRKNEVADIIQARNPHIIGFQEALYHQIMDLCALLPEYSYVGVGRQDGQHEGEFSPIFFLTSRFKVAKSETFWLSETPHFPSKSWNAALPRICTWANLLDYSNTKLTQGVRMYNTHLDHVSFDARLNGMQVILNKIFHNDNTGKNNIILCGDFNVPPEDQVIRLVSKHLNNAQRTALKKINETLPTFTNWNVGLLGLVFNIIDYIFASDYLLPRTFETISEYDSRPVLASDHRPVMATFEYLAADD